MFNVIFYVDFLNYNFNFSREEDAANFIVECLKNSYKKES